MPLGALLTASACADRSSVKEGVRAGGLGVLVAANLFARYEVGDDEIYLFAAEGAPLTGTQISVRN